MFVYIIVISVHKIFVLHQQGLPKANKLQKNSSLSNVIQIGGNSLMYTGKKGVSSLWLKIIFDCFNVLVRRSTAGTLSVIPALTGCNVNKSLGPVLRSLSVYVLPRSKDDSIRRKEGGRRPTKLIRRCISKRHRQMEVE